MTGSQTQILLSLKENLHLVEQEMKHRNTIQKDFERFVKLTKRIKEKLERLSEAGEVKAAGGFIQGYENGKKQGYSEAAAELEGLIKLFENLFF